MSSLQKLGVASWFFFFERAASRFFSSLFFFLRSSLAGSCGLKIVNGNDAEGRAQTEENIAESHMSPTQSGKHMSQGLRGVWEVAMERKQERFTALLHHVTVNLLRDSFFALKRELRQEWTA